MVQLQLELQLPAGWLTRGNNVVDNQDLLAFGHGVLLHLEEILAVLLDVFSGRARARELSLLPDSGKRKAEAESKAGTEEEATGV